jgi:hypothetical protein
MIGFVLALICSLIAIGLWVYGRRARRQYEGILARLAQPRPGGIVLPPGTSYVPLKHPGMTTMPRSLPAGAAPIRAYNPVSRPEGVWAVAGAWSEQPVLVAPNRRTADLLAFWLSCDPVAVDHEVRWACPGRTNPMLEQLHERIEALAEEAAQAAKAEEARDIADAARRVMQARESSSVVILPDES